MCFWRHLTVKRLLHLDFFLVQQPLFCFLPWEGSIVERGLDPSAAARGLAALQAHRSPVARYDSYPQPGGINPPLRLSPVGGGVPDAPQVSSSQREGRRAACPQAAAAACVASQFHCAACGLPAKGRLPYTRGPGMPGPYHITPGRPTSARGFLCGIVNFYTAFYSAAIAQIVANLACSMQNRPFVILGCLTCF